MPSYALPKDRTDIEQSANGSEGTGTGNIIRAAEKRHRAAAHNDRTGQNEIAAQSSGGRLGAVERKLREVIDGIKQIAGADEIKSSSKQRAESAADSGIEQFHPEDREREQSVEPKHKDNDFEFDL